MTSCICFNEDMSYSCRGQLAHLVVDGWLGKYVSLHNSEYELRLTGLYVRKERLDLMAVNRSRMASFAHNNTYAGVAASSDHQPKVVGRCSWNSVGKITCPDMHVYIFVGESSDDSSSGREANRQVCGGFSYLKSYMNSFIAQPNIH